MENQKDSQEISTVKVLNDWKYELKSDTSRSKIIIANNESEYEILNCVFCSPEDVIRNRWITAVDNNVIWM